MDWFRLREGKYLQLEPNQRGITCSEYFPGLWLAKEALLTGDFTQLSATLQEGINSSEHQNFVDQLSRKSDV